MRYRAVLAIVVFALPGAAAEPGGDLRKAKAYLSEVRRHLLRSYLEREKMSEARLAAAAIKSWAGALKALDVPPEQREAALAALDDEETTDGALEAIARAAPAVDVNVLADHAARAMVQETGDPFCRILTQEEMTRLVKMVGGGGGKDVTAGIMAQSRPDGLAVMYVQACTPADEEGINVGDLVTRIGDRPAGGLKPEEASEALKLPPGGALELTVRRGGRDYAFRLKAPKAGVPTVRWQALGQGVGYVRLTIFDGAAVKDVRAALEGLARRGLKGLIFDLRRNPGGALPAATGIADLFLAQDLLIARTVCHYTPSLGGLKFPGLTPPAEYKTREASPFETMPMVCLVDGGSASASELLAGALKDHRRAVLVGDLTYGKGVGQSPIVLSSMFLQRYLYLTILRYSTPHGHEVDHIGVAPDVEAKAAAVDADAWDARWKLRRDGGLERWLDARWGPKLEKAAEYDGFETSAWEGFDGLYDGLGTALSKDVVREELRRAARRRAIEEGAAWACDLQGDAVLQRGLVVLLDRMEGK